MLQNYLEEIPIVQIFPGKIFHSPEKKENRIIRNPNRFVARVQFVPASLKSDPSEHFVDEKAIRFRSDLIETDRPGYLSTNRACRPSIYRTSDARVRPSQELPASKGPRLIRHCCAIGHVASMSTGQLSAMATNCGWPQLKTPPGRRRQYFART